MSNSTFLSNKVEDHHLAWTQPAKLRMALIFLAILLPLIGVFVISVNAAEGHISASNTRAPEAVTPDGLVSSTSANNVDSISFPHTTGTGSDRLTLVGVSWNSNTTATSISGVTFGYDSTELPLSVVGAFTMTNPSPQNRYVVIYGLLDPPIGQAGTVTVTFSATIANGIAAGAVNFAGVDQVDPFEDTASNSGDTATQPNVVLGSLDGDELVFDTLFAGGTDPGPDLTVGPNQTQLWDEGLLNTSGGASYEQATGVSVTMSWTRTLSTNDYWVLGAVPINPIPSYNLTMAVDPLAGGTTEPAAGVYTYTQGTVVPITATANTGYVFDSWSGDVADPSSITTTVTMDADQVITATFTQISHTLTMAVDPLAGGTTEPAAGVYTYTFGTVVPITATANTGYIFDSWTGDVADPTSITTTVTMDADQEVTANFAPSVVYDTFLYLPIIIKEATPSRPVFH